MHHAKIFCVTKANITASRLRNKIKFIGNTHHNKLSHQIKLSS